MDEIDIIICLKKINKDLKISKQLSWSKKIKEKVLIFGEQCINKKPISTDQVKQ